MTAKKNTAAPTSRSDRRALGFSKQRRRGRPGTGTLVAGMLFVAAGAFIGGRSLQSDDNRDRSEPSADALAVETVDTAPSDTVTVGNGAARVAGPAVPAVAIPDGHDGVAVTLPFTAAGGGYVGADNRVNVHAIDPSGVTPASLVLGDVVVLDVSIEVAPRVSTGTAERIAAGNITYLLAVPVDRVADVITATQTRTMYVSLSARGTDGTDARRSADTRDSAAGSPR